MDIRLRYIGERFTGGKLPVDVLGDLPAFRDLILAYARSHWLQLHADRVRVPAHFDQSLSLALTAIEDGSAVPKLTWERESAQLHLPEIADELESIVGVAFQKVVGLVGNAANGDFPNALSAEHVRALNRFGVGLRDDERIAFLGFKGADGHDVYLDAPRRKALITNIHATYVIRHEGTGLLTGVDAPLVQDVGRITVETEKFGKIQLPVDLDRLLGEFNGHMHEPVQFDVDVELDNQDKVKGVVELHNVAIIDGPAAAGLEKCRTRMIELATLKDNWDDEGALAIDKRAHAAALAFLHKRPMLAGGYKIYPTREGGLLFEFDNSGWDLSVEIAPSGTVEFFGVEIGGKGELLPLQFTDIGDEFIKQLDARVGGDGR